MMIKKSEGGISASSYNLWKAYENQIKVINLKGGKKTKMRGFVNYLFRIMVVFFSSFFTTLSFDLLISPHGLYNSGLNGLIQLAFNHFWRLGKMEKSSFRKFYYSTSLILNIVIVSVLKLFFNADLELISTSIFYVIFQIFWSILFITWNFKDYVFSCLSPQNYIFIAILAAIIHTFGYLLIFQSNSTPGGIDVIKTYLSSTKEQELKSVKTVVKYLGFFIVLSIASLDFLILEDNPGVRKNDLLEYLNSNLSNSYNNVDIMMENITKWEDKVSSYETNSDYKFLNNSNDLGNLIIKWSNNEENFYSLISHGNNRIFSEGYLSTHENLIRVLEDLLKDKKNLLSSNENKGIEKLSIQKEIFFMEGKINHEKRHFCQKNFAGYLKYITNNEKLLASFFYVLFSSYLISQLFPQKKMVNVCIEIENGEKLEKALAIFKEFNPRYSVEKNYYGREFYILKFIVNEWRYSLIKSDIKKTGKVFINEIK